MQDAHKLHIPLGRTPLYTMYHRDISLAGFVRAGAQQYFMLAMSFLTFADTNVK